ncbi:MAG: M56 family metallopeptidase [Pseudomonadota bacterium]
MTPLVSSIGWTLVHFAWQGVLLGFATALLLTAMRNARPEQRYAVACSALLLCIAWPAVELYMRLDGSGAATATIRFADQVLGRDGAAASGGVLGFLQANLMPIVVLWAACAAGLALRMALGLLWIGQVSRRRTSNVEWQARVSRMAAQFGVTRAVGLRVVDNLASPITAGWWRPVVLLPAALVSGMPPELLEALLAHEMAHVQRFDYLVNLGQNVIEILLFYHPAVWWISGRIRVEREQIADDIAARQLGAPRRLALALSELEKFQFSGHHLAMAANGGDLMARVKRLLRPDSQALNWKAAIPVLGLAVACLAVYMHADAAPKPNRVPPVADFSSCKKPRWPTESLQAEHTGTVTLKFLIGEQGQVLDSQLKTSSGHPLLDEAARNGIQLCHFKPARQDGVPVQSWMQMKYVWMLQ